MGAVKINVNPCPEHVACCIFSSGLDFSMEANNINPDQTAPLGSGSILFVIKAT